MILQNLPPYSLNPANPVFLRRYGEKPPPPSSEWHGSALRSLLQNIFMGDIK